MAAFAGMTSPFAYPQAAIRRLQFSSRSGGKVGHADHLANFLPRPLPLAHCLAARSRPIPRRRRPPRPLPRSKSGCRATSRGASKVCSAGCLRRDEPPPRGLYVHGEVGRGKTMLMDLFFQASDVEHKRRAHFHEFMADVHERIYGYRQKITRGEIAEADPMRADRQGDLRRGVAALLRRIPRHRHRRCDDPGPAVRKTVRARHCRGRDLQCRARGSLQRRAQPRAVPAVHRADRAAYGRAAARCAHRFPARKTHRREHVAGAGRRRGRGRARQGLGQDDRQCALQAARY